MSSPRRRTAQPQGFTLVELLLYTSLLAIIVSVVSIGAATLLEGRIKSQTIGEVEQQGQQVLQYIAQVARNAEAVTAPPAGSSAAALTLDVPTVADDPTVLDISAGALRVTEGAGSPVVLTNDDVTASGLTVTNLSRTGTPGTVRIEFTLTYSNPTGRNELDYSKTFYASASLRRP